MDFSDIQTLVEQDMAAVDALIHQRLSSDVALIQQLSNYIIGSGGKRLRPILAILTARACGYQGDQHIDIAAIVEFIHTATLLHDDVVDSSDQRRGKDTANHVWGNAAAVLVGDFLYSRSFEMMVTVDDMRVMEILAGTTNTIAEGEVLQLQHCNNPDVTEADYLSVIHSKTAKLFEAAGLLGGVLAAQDQSLCDQLARYGKHLGTAFQMIDDVLDYTADSEEMGKNVGDDLAEGKPTLPLILAMQKTSPDAKQLIRKSIEQGGLEELETIITAVKKSGAIEQTLEKARAERDASIECLSALPNSPYKQALETLANLAVDRRH